MSPHVWAWYFSQDIYLSWQYNKGAANSHPKVKSPHQHTKKYIFVSIYHIIA